MSQTYPDKKAVFELLLNRTSGDDFVIQATPSKQETSDWHEGHGEGQLSVDVFETKEDMIVVSTVAGVDVAAVEVYVHGDLLTIRGDRRRPEDFAQAEHLYHSECFWGVFSRTIVLPVEVHADMASAEYKNGILTVRIPKRQTHGRIAVTVVEE